MATLFLALHSFTASLKPWHSVMSAWPWAHSTNCLISKAHGPVGALDGGAGAVWTGAGAAGAGAGVEEPPENMLVTPAPTT